MIPSAPAYRRAVLLSGLLILASCAETELAIDVAKRVADTVPRPHQTAGVEPNASREKIVQTASPGGPEADTQRSRRFSDGRWLLSRTTDTYDEVGTASWYGPGFAGRTTANGERFNPMALTAAHRTLPIPSVVKVTNLDNGRGVTVRINDRGPFSDDRIIDLSQRAAEVLGMVESGTARVRVQVLEDESMRLAQLFQAMAPISGHRTTVGPDQSTIAPGAFPVEPRVDGDADGAFIQAGAFRSIDNARRVQAELADLGEARISTVLSGGRDLHRVRVGPVERENVDGTLKHVIEAGHQDAHVVDGT